MIHNLDSIEVQDEAVSQGRARIFNFAGTGVSAAVSGQTATITVSGGGGGGSFSPVIVEKDLGSLPRYSGTFDITGLSGLTPGNHVYIQQAAGPYTGKGDRQDEAEMDQANVTGYVVDASTVRAYWTCSPKSGPLAGNVRWAYIPGA